MISRVACVLLTVALVAGSPVSTQTLAMLCDIRGAAADIQPAARSVTNLFDQENQFGQKRLSYLQLKDLSKETVSTNSCQEELREFPCIFNSTQNITSMLQTACRDLTIINSYLKAAKWVQESGNLCLLTVDNLTDSFIRETNETMKRVKDAYNKSKAYLIASGIDLPANQTAVDLPQHISTPACSPEPDDIKYNKLHYLVARHTGLYANNLTKELTNLVPC